MKKKKTKKLTTPAPEPLPPMRWESYHDEIIGKDSPQLAKEVEEYSKRRHDGPETQHSQEELARLREENAVIASQYQFVKPEDYEDEAARVGRIMSHDEFITILRRKLNLKCFYREMNHPQKIALWAVKDDLPAESVGWVKRGLTTELSIMRFDDHGVPLDEKFRGWRTVLMNLVMKGFLKEHDVRRVFGRAKGPASEKYNSFMQQFRTIP
jgi:hypothetical protein